METPEIRLKQIDEEIDKLHKLIEEKDKKWDYNKSFDEYWDYVRPEKVQIALLDGEKRMLMPYELNELPDYGDVMPLKVFIDAVKDGSFIDDDGHGYYVKDGKETNIMIVPSDVNRLSIRAEFTEIIWYNR